MECVCSFVILQNYGGRTFSFDSVPPAFENPILKSSKLRFEPACKPARHTKAAHIHSGEISRSGMRHGQGLAAELSGLRVKSGIFEQLFFDALHYPQ
jgi:hypothetical protein